MITKKMVRIEWKSEEYDYSEVSSTEKGLYQFYGWHPCYGNNVLLYIGKTEDMFKNRMKNHDFLNINHEKIPRFFRPKKIKVRLGTIRDRAKLKTKTIEKILIFTHNPAWNSHHIHQFTELNKCCFAEYEGVVIENTGNFGALVEKFEVGKDNFRIIKP